MCLVQSLSAIKELLVSLSEQVTHTEGAVPQPAESRCYSPSPFLADAGPPPAKRARRVVVASGSSSPLSPPSPDFSGLEVVSSVDDVLLDNPVQGGAGGVYACLPASAVRLWLTSTPRSRTLWLTWRCWWTCLSFVLRWVQVRGLLIG